MSNPFGAQKLGTDVVITVGHWASPGMDREELALEVL